jgi:hypothetical protein
MLSDRQLGDFRRDGYLLIRGLYDRKEMRDMTEWTDEVTAWPEVPGKYMMYFEQSKLVPGRRILCRMEDLEPYHAGFRALFCSGKMRGAVSDLLGEDAVLFKDKINFKLPGGGGFEAHQDVQAGWARYASLHITALVTVDRATIANGCLEIATDFSGSRQLIGSEWEPLLAEQLAGLHWAYLEAEPGDAVFFDSFVPHRSAPNKTRDPRRVLYYTYNAVSAGDHLVRYYADKRASFPPDIEREAGREYRYRV